MAKKQYGYGYNAIDDTSFNPFVSTPVAGNMSTVSGMTDNSGIQSSGLGSILRSNNTTVSIPTNTSNSTSGLFGNSGLFGSVGGALQGLGALANAYTGYKNYQLAQNTFDYNKALGNANLYNAATQANNAMTNATNVGNALAGSTMTDAEKSASLAGLSSKYLKTTI